MNTGLFFTYQTDLPEGVGYSLFHAEHFVIMLLCLALIAAGLCAYERCKDASMRKRMRRVTASSAMALIVLRLIFVSACGAALIYELPLHLCSIAGILSFIFEFGYGKMPEKISGLIGHLLFSVCLVGAALAIVFSDGTAYPAFHFITIESNLFHALVIMYILICKTEGMIMPSVKDSYKSVLFLAAIAAFVFAVDKWLHANYMFLLGPSAGSPLMPFYEKWGYAGYLISLCAIAVIEIYAVNLIALSVDKRMRRSDM
ncbi:MAG: YwaF family protein [Lachnospiraceae bacterium]|nr:YwaF family protein [Lachnospiraceae bacterium]